MMQCKNLTTKLFDVHLKELSARMTTVGNAKDFIFIVILRDKNNEQLDLR